MNDDEYTPIKCYKYTGDIVRIENWANINGIPIGLEYFAEPLRLGENIFEECNVNDD